jgi:hypothetical protein
VGEFLKRDILTWVDKNPLYHRRVFVAGEQLDETGPFAATVSLLEEPLLASCYTS